MPTSPPPSPDRKITSPKSPSAPPSPPPEPSSPFEEESLPSFAITNTTTSSGDDLSRIITSTWLLDRLGPVRRWGGDGLSRLLSPRALALVNQEWPLLDVSPVTRASITAAAATRARILLSLLVPAACSSAEAVRECRSIIATALNCYKPTSSIGSAAATDIDEGDESLHAAYNEARNLVLLSIAIVLQLRPSFVPQQDVSISSSSEDSPYFKAMSLLQTSVKEVVTRVRARLRVANVAAATTTVLPSTIVSAAPNEDNVISEGFARALLLGAEGGLSAGYGGGDGGGGGSGGSVRLVRGISLDAMPFETRFGVPTPALSAALICSSVRRDFALNATARLSTDARDAMIRSGIIALDSMVLSNVGIQPPSGSSEELEKSLDAISLALHPGLDAILTKARAGTAILSVSSTLAPGVARFIAPTTRVMPVKRPRDAAALMIGDEAEAEAAIIAAAARSGGGGGGGGRALAAPKTASTTKSTAPTPTLLDLLKDAPLLSPQDRIKIENFVTESAVKKAALVAAADAATATSLTSETVVVSTISSSSAAVAVSNVADDASSSSTAVAAATIATATATTTAASITATTPPPVLATFVLREFIPVAKGGSGGIGGGVTATARIALTRVFVELDYTNLKWRAYQKKV